MTRRRWTGVCEVLLFLAILAIAFPVFVPSGLDIIGLQGVTPEKVILPLLCVATLALIRLGGGWRKIFTRFSVTTAFLIGWLLVGILVNRSYQFAYNLRAWSWLVLDFGLLVAVQQRSREERGRRGLLMAAGSAIVLVALLGLMEVAQVPGLEPLFRFVRPDWGQLGLHGPGPTAVLDFHAYVGHRMRLMSTLSNDTCWFLPLGAAVFATLLVFVKARPVYRRVLCGAGYAVVLLTVLLTLSRTAVVIMTLGVTLLTILGMKAGRGRGVAVLWLSSGLAIAAFVLFFGSTTPVLGKKFYSLGRVSKIEQTVTKDGKNGSGALGRNDQSGGETAVAMVPKKESEVNRLAIWSLVERLALWRVAITMWRNHPLFGVGFANFRTRLYAPGVYRNMFGVAGRVLDVQGPHNFFLWVAAVGGVPTLVSIILLLIFALLSLTREVLQSRDFCPWKGGILVLWVSLGAFMLAGFTLLSPVTQTVFAVLVGFTDGLLQGENKPQGDLDRSVVTVPAELHG